MAITKPGVKLSDLDVERVDAVDRPATKSKFLMLKSEDADELRKNIQSTADAADALIDLIEKDTGVSSEIRAKALDLGKSIGRTEKAGPANEADCVAAGGTWADGACTMPEAKAAEKAESTACAKCAAPVAEGKFVAKNGEVRKGDTCPMCGAPVDGDGKYAPGEDTAKAAEKAASPAASDIAVEVAKALAPALAKLAETNAAIAKAIESAPKVVSKRDAPASRQASGDDAEPVKKAARKMGDGIFTSIVFGSKSE